LDVIPAAIHGVLVVKPRRSMDKRGHSTETYDNCRLAHAGIHLDFAQDNLTFSNLTFSKPREYFA
jgi:dTDP-4-dehydrorhamnose 3,5-epimerase-like enzyme